jgi:hypothetical protein
MQVKIVHNKLLGGWYVVRGPHQTPLTGRFETKTQAKTWLGRNNDKEAAKYQPKIVLDAITNALNRP